MAPVFDPGVFDSGVFDTGGAAGMVATMSSGGATFVGTLAASVILLAATMASGGAAFSADLTNFILLVALMASGGATLTPANLKVARFMGRLRTCGDPLSTSTQDWILA